MPISRLRAAVAVLLCAVAYSPATAEVRWVPGQLLVQPRAGHKTLARARLAAEGTPRVAALAHLGVDVVRTAPGNEAALERRLKASGHFDFVERNYLATVFDTPAPDDPLFAQQWGLSDTHTPEAWVAGFGAGVVIAVLDTGIDYRHPDLAGRIVPGINPPMDDNGHGTHMAGIAAATGFNGIGLVGVAPEAQLLPIKVMNASGSGDYATIASGIISAVDQGARVINLSLGGDADSFILHSAINYAEAHGVVVVASSGNTPTGSPTYPAAFDTVLAVGAIDDQNVVASFSNFGPWLDLVAPGTGITTTDWSEPPGGFAGSYGTSPASPFVSGAAALMLAANPELTPAQVRSILQQTSDDLCTTGFDVHCGWGRLNVANAVAAAVALGSGEDSQTPSVSLITPTSDTVAQDALSFSAAASDDLGVTRVEYTVDGAVVAGASAAPFSASWDAHLAIAGPHVVGAYAYDLSGHRGSATTVTVTLTGADISCGTPGTLCAPGGGTARSECAAEWLLIGTDTPSSSVRLHNLMTCRDGDACDQDGRRDGKCTFPVGVCFATNDPRLVDSGGHQLCQAGTLTQFKLSAPNTRKHLSANDAANAATLLGAVATLAQTNAEGTCTAGARGWSCETDGECDTAAGAGNGRCALQQVALSAVGAEQCTKLHGIVVPLRQTVNGAVFGKVILRTRTSQRNGGGTDADSLQLVCTPSNTPN